MEPKQLHELSTNGLDSSSTLQQNIVPAPVLALPCSNGLLTLDTDAFHKQIGCVLMQDQKNGATTHEDTSLERLMR